MGLKEKVVKGGESEIMESGVRICRGYLKGPWKKATNEDIVMKRLSGGLSNFLYHIKLKDCKAVEPNQVLLRIYGQIHGQDDVEHLITESVIFTLLSERKIGPKLYGVFPGGRIEEFIEASALHTGDLREPLISVAIAKKLAVVHTLHIPLSKEPRWMWDTMKRWIVTIQSRGGLWEYPGKKLQVLNLEEERVWLKSHLSKISSPVVFCHNDLQEGNILCRKTGGKDNLVFIDFEYCAYNNRGFDLANHFIEWTYNYTEPKYPFFGVNKDNYPTTEQMQLFLETYLKTMYPTGNVPNPEVNNVQSMICEVRHFTLASHFFWLLWGMVNARSSSIPFGFWDYADERYECYLKLKNELLLENVMFSEQKTPQNAIGTKRKQLD